MTLLRFVAVGVCFLVSQGCAPTSREACDPPSRCASDDVAVPDASTSFDAAGTDAARVDGSAEADGATPPDGFVASITGVERTSRELVCKLISGDESDRQSANRTHTRFNLRGTDLGTPAIVGDDLALFFGDTHGWQGIWAIGEDPDSIARVPLAAARSDLSTLCHQLQFLVTNDEPSVAADTDPTVLRDFDGAYLTAPPGQSIRDYIDRPVPFFETSTGSFAGSFEVPAGALGRGDQAFVFWATRPGTREIGPMRLSFVARWDGGHRAAQQILYPLDDLDRDRSLGGHFLQVSPVEHEGYVYLFGTGEYRRDGVHVARKPSSTMETAGSIELFDPRTGAWVEPSSMDADARASIPAVFEEDVRGIGELGVQYVADPGIFVMMFQQLSDSSAGNHMVLAVAQEPQGPWFSTRVITMHDPAFQAEHCCLGDTCPGNRILHCDRAGLYAIYPLPLIEVSRSSDGVLLDVPFTASTWQPYNVVLFRTRVLVRGL
ncbi:MAG: hypothetical protein CMN30_09370 [Sandaracinus sp.]|nr:hypothetical protein [Sandaracinus sp.]